MSGGPNTVRCGLSGRRHGRPDDGRAFVVLYERVDVVVSFRCGCVLVPRERAPWYRGRATDAAPPG